jgi:hypothetical protein
MMALSVAQAERRERRCVGCWNARTTPGSVAWLSNVAAETADVYCFTS